MAEAYTDNGRSLDLRDQSMVTTAERATPRPEVGTDDPREIGEIFGTLSEDVSDLINTQMRLAVVEAKEEVNNVVESAKFFAGFAGCAYMAVFMLSFAAAWGLATVMPTGFAFLIIGAIYGLVGGFLFLRGRKQAEHIHVPPPETKKSIEEDVTWLKQQKS